MKLREELNFAPEEREIVLTKKEALFHALFPVQSHVSKKNKRPIFKNRSTHRVFLGKSGQLRDAESHLLLQLRRAAMDLRIHEPFRGDLRVVFMFYFPRDVYCTKKGSRSLRLPDLSNLYELPQDCLQKAGIIENDTQIEAHDGSRRVVSPDGGYWLEISLFKYGA